MRILPTINKQASGHKLKTLVNQDFEGIAERQARDPGAMATAS
jgi:hypothetical protein